MRTTCVYFWTESKWESRLTACGGYHVGTLHVKTGPFQSYELANSWGGVVGGPLQGQMFRAFISTNIFVFSCKGQILFCNNKWFLHKGSLNWHHQLTRRSFRLTTFVVFGVYILSTDSRHSYGFLFSYKADFILDFSFLSRTYFPFSIEFEIKDTTRYSYVCLLHILIYM